MRTIPAAGRKPQTVAGEALPGEGPGDTEPANDGASRSIVSPPARTEALVDLIARLKRAQYQFVTPSLATHRRVLKREGPRLARDLRDVFGWSLPFEADLLGPGWMETLAAAGVVQHDGKGVLRSALRASSLDADIFLHSAFPAAAADAVFFGPDSYRFASFLKAELADAPGGGLLVDLGAGAGVGGVVAARSARPAQVVLTDINPRALELCRVNAAGTWLDVRLVLGDGLQAAPDNLQLVVANPPFIAGRGGRTYRDGGDLHGARVSLEWSLAAAAKLARGGRLLLYTGSAIIGGEDRFAAALKSSLAGEGFRLTYRELDPDIFGAQLSAPAYQDVERIAAVGVRIDRI